MTGILRVLLVDDHLLFRKGIKSLLAEQSDLRLAGEASDYWQAMQFLRANPCDVVVTDLSMPGRDGLELVAEISGKLKSRPKAVPIVVLTGGGPSAALQAISRGAKHAILKGATSDDILVAIETAMTGA